MSKWESAQSIPDLNKIIKLTEIFGVSTDFLLKEGAQAEGFTESEKAVNVRQVSLEQGLSYIDSKLHIAGLTVRGVALSVSSPMPLMFLLALASSEQSYLSSDMAVTLGIAGLLVMVAVGASFFIRINRHQDEIAPIENERFELSYGVHDVFSQKLKDFQLTYNKRLSLGVALFITSAIPFLAVAILSGRQDLTLLMLGVMFLIIATGLSIVIPASAQFDAYKYLLSEGDRDAGKSENTKNAEKLGAFYWPFLVAIYLGWSFWTMNWGITWIVFPVGAVAFAALVGLMGLLKKESGHRCKLSIYKFLRGRYLYRCYLYLVI